MKDIKIFVLIGIPLILSFSGCVTMELGKSEGHSPGRVELQPPITELPKPDRLGVYHKIKPKETIWRIAKTYDVVIDDIAKANSITDIAKVEKGDVIFIPGAQKIKEIFLETEEMQKKFIWPIKGSVISRFGQHRTGQINKGIDIRARQGYIVKAARTGRVVFADYLPGEGYMIILDHADGLYSLYSRNAKLLVELDDLVFKNTALAYVGLKDDLAFLHFEIRRNAISDNPLNYLP